jgi:hypothetical protein
MAKLHSGLMAVQEPCSLGHQFGASSVIPGSGPEKTPFITYTRLLQVGGLLAAR